MPWSCVCGAGGRSGGLGPLQALASPPVFPPFPRAPCGACCGLSRPGVPSFRLPVRHSMRYLRSAVWVWLRFGSAPRVCCVCVRLCSRSVRPPPPVGVARAPRVVPVRGAGRAVPGGLCPSAFPAPVPCSTFLARGGWPGPFVPLPGSGSLAPLWAGLCVRGGPALGGRGGGRARGWGPACVPPPLGAW